MAIVFGWRGNSLDARYSSAGKTPVKIGEVANIVQSSDASFIGGNVAFTGSVAKILKWRGFENTPNGRVISCNTLVEPTYTGSPASSRALTACLYVGPDRMGRIEVIHTSAGNIVVTVVNEAGTAIVNAVTAAAWSPTSGTKYDVTWTWDGTASANSFKVYVDATLQGSGITPTAAFSSSWSNQYFSTITFGNSATSILPVCKIYEITIWDTVITPSSVTLDSGTGSLNGASRSSPVACTVFDGQLNTSAGAANIRSGTSEVIAGVTITGTAAIPTAANVRSGTATDATTGTLAVPSAANVRSGTAVDAGTGTCVVPSAANVRSGTSVDATTGTMVANLAADVKHGVASDGGTGTYRGADLWTTLAANKIKSGETQTQDGSLVTGTAVTALKAVVKIGQAAYDGTGEYDGSDRFTSIPESKVEDGYAYKDNSTTNNKEGTALSSAAATTKHGVLASDGVGTYRGDDLWEAVAAEDLRLDTEVLQDGDTITGELEARTVPTTAREACDYILRWIGAETLTDDEWATIDQDLVLLSTPQEYYDALYSVMESRESVSTMLDRLAAYFEAKGYDVTEPTPSEDTESKITIGFELDDVAGDTDVYESNIFIGGELD